jgi:hypothetical protein
MTRGTGKRVRYRREYTRAPRAARPSTAQDLAADVTVSSKPPVA